ncbi:unnamed protein product [Ranitomeya imitator]|uniref:Uncharacterized protein n=1 Tax=Ranitomeya imitator TaxID=111125 RepID=A0ABN9LXA5_9NEOB|nr:unnamed protein product [Ranitomeya imitator]
MGIEESELESEVWFTNSTALPAAPDARSSVPHCTSEYPLIQAYGRDDSASKKLLCTAWDVREGDAREEESLTKPSLHHTGSPVRVQRGKSAATCSHGTNNSDYELSLDLKNKQIEMLEHKYGGHGSLHHPGTAFRQYQLSKNFEKIRDSLLQSRLPPTHFPAKGSGLPHSQPPISGAFTELEDSFTEQVQSLAKSIDDALSTWSLKTMCAFPEAGSYQIRETFMQQNPELEPPKLEELEGEDGQLGTLPKSNSTLMMAFRDGHPFR